ncbi:MAG: hypothetical protein K2W95_29600 [Candidatus Obscuribacterales bacterium]|nr:hypothetical protein [Candidatus Obscuribacterales bacterium]
MAESLVGSSCHAEQAAAQRPLDATVVSDALNAASGALGKFQKEALDSLRSTVQLVPAVADRVERSVNRIQTDKVPAAPVAVEWVMAINIATKDFGKGDNIERRLDELNKLAANTKGKPVAITVQVAHYDLQKDTPRKAYEFFVPTPYHVDQYVIHDGKMTKTGSLNSSGYAGDVKELLSFTAKQFDAKKSALLIDSHGNGNVGLTGDMGKATISQLAKAIETGWPGDGKIDVIDFDSCLMAQEGVLKAMRPLTDHVVASPETERALGQDLTKTVKAIIEHPEMTPDEFAETMVEIARLQPLPVERKEVKVQNFYDLLEKLKPQEGEKIPPVQVRTLAHFSLVNYEKFRSRLDDYGDALSEAIKDPKNRQTIDRLIEESPSYGDWFGEAGECKDLKSFVDSMFREIGRGRIADPDGQLRITGGRVLDSHKKLVPSYSGFEAFGARGGLSDFLPDRYSLDFHKRARNWVPSGDYSAACTNMELLAENPTKYIEAIETHLKYVAADMKKMEKDATEADWNEATRAYKSAQDAVKAFRSANDTKSTLQAVSDLKKTASDLGGTRLFQDRLAAEERGLKKEIDDKYNAQMVDTKSGWGRFRQSLRRLD